MAFAKTTYISRRRPYAEGVYHPFQWRGWWDFGTGALGDKGKLWGYDDLYDGAEPVAVKFTRSPGHFAEWIRAIRGGEPPVSNFPDYAGPLAEVVVAGNLAVWVADKPGLGPKVEWDAKNMKVTNIDGLEAVIKPTYRKGYTLDV